jgi:uncharacterized membrane protein YecN with MAPEG domain
MLATPDKLLAALVTILACILCTCMAIAVSRARTRLQISPPAMTGSPELERVIRVHSNTVENLTIFLALLWLAVIYFHGWIPGIIGLIWIVGRIIYMVGYYSGADRRLPGFIVAQLSQLALLILAIVGLIQTWTAITAS